MRKITLIFLSVLLLFAAVAYSEEVDVLREWEETFTVQDIIHPNTVFNYEEHNFIDPYEDAIQREAIFHINDNKQTIVEAGYATTLYDLVPIIKLDFFYIFNKEKAKGMGYLGSFEYDSLFYKNKNCVGIKVSTTVLYQPYH